MTNEEERKTIERKRQIQFEIDWLKKKIEIVKRPRHKADLERQLKEREYNLHLGIFTNKNT